MQNLFVLIVSYQVPYAEIELSLQEHRDYLRLGYEAGFLLASGPQNPKTGGLILGKFDSVQSAQKFTQNDPFAIKNLATYEVIEFTPVLHHSLLDSFLANKL